MNIGIIGLGLIGGSFGRTAVKAGYTVYGTDINAETLEKAQLLKAVDYVLDTDNAGKLDVLISAVNPSDFSSVIMPYLQFLKKGAVVMDFSGTKRGVVEVMKRFSESYPDLFFIGGHPMAGREFSGIDKSTATLFNKASMIFVPVKADIFVLDKIKLFFISLGFSEAVITTAENHDRMIAFTSQLCHVVSNAFIKSKTAREHFGYSAGSYNDLTRVARMNSDMWTELMLENGDFLSEELETLLNNLGEYLEAIRNRDRQKLKELLKEGNDVKELIDQRRK